MDIRGVPDDVLRRVYAECLRIKHADNRAAAVERVADDVLSTVRATYTGEGATVHVHFPGLGDVRVQIDAYRGTTTKRAFAVTATADGHEPIVHGMMFMRRAADCTWALATGPFGSTAGANLAFERLCDFMNDVAKAVAAKYAAAPSRTFDRRDLTADVVRAKVKESGAEAAAAYFGVSAYRVRKLIA